MSVSLTEGPSTRALWQLTRGLTHDEPKRQKLEFWVQPYPGSGGVRTTHLSVTGQPAFKQGPWTLTC